METVLFTTDIQNSLAEVLRARSYSKVVVLTDVNTREHCLPLIQDALLSDVLHITVPAGEQHKTL